MNESAEGQSVPPTSGHILDLDARIALGHPSAPELQSFHSAFLGHSLKDAK